MRPRHALAALAVPVLALTAAACGDSGPSKDSPEQQVRSVVTRFGEATKVKDYQEICDRLIAKSLSDNVEEFGLPCELAFRQGLDPVKDPRLVIRSVSVTGAKAKVVVRSTAANQPPSSDTLELTRLPKQGWRITALGAAPKAETAKKATKPATGGD